MVETSVCHTIVFTVGLLLILLSQRGSSLDVEDCSPRSGVFEGVPFAVDCCPPASERPAIYWKPDTGPVRVRRPAHRLDSDFIAKYKLAYERMKALPADDPRSLFQQNQAHVAYTNMGYNLDIHHSQLFFPFHRLYIYFHEKILGALIDDPTFALPYWNWDDQLHGGNVIPAIFQDEGSSLFDSNRSAVTIVSLKDCGDVRCKELPKNITQSNLIVMKTHFYDVKDREAFYGQPYRNATNFGPGAVEFGPHAALHSSVGRADLPFEADMGSIFSCVLDPIFFTHHSNIDRLWEVWKSLNNNTNIEDEFTLNTELIFYDHNKDLVKCKAKDALLDIETMFKYTYESAPDHQRVGYVPPSCNPSSLLQMPAPKLDSPVTLRGKPVVVSIEQPRQPGNNVPRDEVLLLDVAIPAVGKIAFDIFVGTPDVEAGSTNCIEFVGSFSGKSGSTSGAGQSGNIRFSIKKAVQASGLEDMEWITITIVPTSGVEFTIQGARIMHS